MTYPCGFAAVNNGKHCIINGHCVVCHSTLERRLQLASGVEVLEVMK